MFAGRAVSTNLRGDMGPVTLGASFLEAFLQFRSYNVRDGQIEEILIDWMRSAMCFVSWNHCCLR